MVYFVPSTRGFIPESWKADGTYTDETWPSDAVLLTEDESAGFWKQVPPGGMELGVNEKGRPVWIPLPTPSDEELVVMAERKKGDLLAEANLHISVLTDATDPDIMGDDILPGDVALLKAWKAYRVKLSRITNMLNPVWPDLPDS